VIYVLLEKLDHMGNKRHELWAEALRDVGILFLVFAPLETLLRKERGSWLDWLVAGTIATLGLLLIEKGVRMGTEK
jgi:hypothetical protein